MARDLTQAQFNSALKRNNIGPERFMGYHNITKRTSVSTVNTRAGSTRRTKLAYLIAEKHKAEAMEKAIYHDSH